METSLKLQMDVKNNAEDLRRYMLDLQNWEDEMKKKETGLKSQDNKVTDIPPPRNKVKRNITDGRGDEKRSTNNEKKPKKIQAYDYSAWDKYDVDKACAEIDEESEKDEGESEASQSNAQETIEKEEEKENDKGIVEKSNLKNLDEAFYEKELGNNFVRKEKWEDAIKCYTRAIDLDSKNAIYYANRSLCFMKLKNFRSAEVDATVAIQLDNTYVKAYQRRAYARLALGQIEEALSDYREIVKLEPNNSHANAEIVKIEKRLKDGNSNLKEAKTEKKIFDPKSIFKTETKKNTPVKISKVEVKEKKVEEKKEVKNQSVSSKKVEGKKEVKEDIKIEELTEEKEKLKKSPEVKEENDVFGEIPHGFTVVKPVQIPPHLRSKKPLRRVPVKDVTSDSEIFEIFNSKCSNTESRKEITEKKPENTTVTIRKEETPDIGQIQNFPKPESFLQFQHAWKILKNNPQQAFKYLQKTTPKTLYKILRHNMESDLFSELISVLSVSVCDETSDVVCSFLNHLAKVDRFRSLLMFLSSTDKKNLIECINRLKFGKHECEIKELLIVYELESVEE